MGVRKSERAAVFPRNSKELFGLQDFYGNLKVIPFLCFPYIAWCLEQRNEVSLSNEKACFLSYGGNKTSTSSS